MKIDNIDNIANKEKSPDKAERSASIEDIKKTQKFFDFNDLSNATTINNSLLLQEKEEIFDYLPPGSSKLKKLLLNSDPEVANLNIATEKVHNHEYLINNNNNNNNNNSSYLSVNNATAKINNNIVKSKNETNSVSSVSGNSGKKDNSDKKSPKKASKQKLFSCSECNEYFLKLNLFNHMKSVHNKFTCLYCYGFFVNIEDLEKHLVKKHKVQNTSFFDELTLRNYFNVKETEIVSKVIKAVCCKCGLIFTITDNNFHAHCCGSALKETGQIVQSTNNVDLAVQNDFNHIDPSMIVKQQNDPPKDDTYFDQAIEQWLQPNAKTTFNGASTVLNEQTSQIVSHQVSNANEKPRHIEEQKEADSSEKLVVPKLTLKIPKAFQNQQFDNIDSDEDSGDEEEDEEGESASDEENENDESNKSESVGKNLSNSNNNDEGSSLSDTDNNESSTTNKGDEKAQTIELKKRPENMPSLKLKIKNLTSNPESVLENYDYNSTIKTSDEIPETQNDVDMTECPMDIEPTLENSMNVEVEPEPKKIIIDGVLIIPANEDILPLNIKLDESLDKIPILKLMKICLQASFPYCLYCNHARKIVVNGKGLGIHFITHHRFHALVDSITAEELHAEKIVSKLEMCMEELKSCFFNLDTYDDHDEEKKEGHVTISHDKLYECFQCRFQTPIHKELYLHNRKMHQKSQINCLMCKMGFYSYSELLCHICPGQVNKQVFNDYKFYCCLCNMDNIPSAFRLMVHLRKKHYACDVCLEKCSDQSKLSSHVWKHKLAHICYRCHIFYQNKADIMKHLFWKHGTEGIECKKCLQKKWPHVYHFCIPPAAFTCTHCEMKFSRAMSLKVHLRLHEDGSKYACTEIECEKKFISKKLLLRHLERHQSALAALENKDRERTEGTVLIPHEIPDGSCTRTIPVVFKRFIKKPPVRKIENEPKVEAKVEPEQPKKEDEKETKTLPDLPETKLNLSESSESDSSSSSSSDEGSNKNNAKKLLTKESTVSSLISEPNEVKHSVIDSAKDLFKKKGEENVESNKSTVQSLAKISSLTDSDDDDEIDSDKKSETKDDTIEPMKNIFDNLKSFQESQQVSEFKINDVKDGEMHKLKDEFEGKVEKKDELKSENEIAEENEIEDKLPDKVILHVCISDHDYAKLYRPVVGTTEDDVENMIESAKIDKDKKKSHDKSSKSDAKAAQSKKKTSDKSNKNDDFSSSDSSSGSSSDSSSGSSSGSSSSSSSASTSDSSSSEASSMNTSRPRTKKYTKKRSKKDKKGDVEPEEQEVPRDPDDIIYESDLQTDETDTDEDFYDEHPLKMNNQALTEKRKQLGTLDGIIENSRPSTPSLPPDENEKIEKRIRMKKRKRDHKKFSSPSKRLHRDSNSIVNPDDESISYHHHSINNPPETPHNYKHHNFGFMHTSTPISTAPRIELHQANQIRQLLQSTQQQPVLPILKEQQQYYHNQHHSIALGPLNSDYINVSHVSSAQSSRMNSDNEQSGVKRSQRRRIPNKFYGYTSDDDTMASQVMQNLNDPFKPIPPPNLTWHKDDLPSRIKSPNPSTPRVAPLKLNLGNDQLQQQLHTFAVEHQQQPVPPQVQDNHGSPQQHAQQLPFCNDLSVSNSAYNYKYSDSTEDDQLHISEPRKRKRKLPSQSMYAFHTLETPPTVSPNQPPIPRLKLTIGSNNKIRRRNINPLKPPVAKKRKTIPKNNLSNNIASAATTSLNPYAKQYDSPSGLLQTSSSFDQNSGDQDSKVNKLIMAQEKQQKLEEAIINTQQYFQRYNHTQVANSELPQQPDAKDNDGRVYCYCRRPYDDLQGMIGCDGPSCQIEWFHFECVGILVAPKGNWFCPSCSNAI